MKFKNMAIAFVATSVLLTGCTTSNEEAVEKDGKDVVASLTDKDFFADDLFKNISETTSGKSAYFEAVLQKIVDEKFPVTDEMKDDADYRLEVLESNYAATYGDESDAQLLVALQASGFQDLNDYRDSLISALQYSEFLQAYVDANYDEVMNDYYEFTQPRTLQIVKISVADIENPTEDELATIDEVAKLVDSSKDFGELASERSSDSSATNNGNIGIVDNTMGIGTTYGDEVETQAFLLNEGEVTKEAVKGTDGYYFIKCLSTNKEEISNEIKGLGIDSPLISYDAYLVYLAYNSYTIKYENSEVEENISTTVKEELEAREELRKGDEE